VAFKFFYFMPASCVHMFLNQKSTEKTVEQVRGAWVTSQICTYTSSVDMLLWNFIKSFPNFETVFDKISRKKTIKKKNWIKFFKCCQMLIRLLSETTETTIWKSLTSPSKYWWNSPSTCLFFSVFQVLPYISETSWFETLCHSFDRIFRSISVLQ
jgi:hypothetical protein